MDQMMTLVRRQSDNDFIDDDETSFQDQNPFDYRLQKVTRDLKRLYRTNGCGKNLSVLVLNVLITLIMSMIHLLGLKRGSKSSRRI